MTTPMSEVMDAQAWVGATNPVLPGFHPDPSVCRVGEGADAWYYLVTSTFEYLPGLPVHRSRDLVNWELVGHVITDQLDFSRISDSDGLYAPTIRHDGERFFVVCKHVGGPAGGEGNFIVTAEDAAGPWSAPVWWRQATGGDPSLFLEDGRIWAHAARQTDRQDWSGQGEIWVREVDPLTLQLTGPESVVFTGAVIGAIWTEGPHLYRRGDFLHLIAAEGGTGRHHAVVAARGNVATERFEAGASNPVLTHRHLGSGSTVVNVGHADLVEAADGSWWATVLASRLVDGVDLLGRETFLVPVVWEDGAPIFAPGVGTLVPEPDTPVGPDGQPAVKVSEPDEPWVAVRRLPQEIADLGDESGLVLRAGGALDDPMPAFIGQRLLSPYTTVSLGLTPQPMGEVVEHGLALRQSGRQWLTVGMAADGDQPRGSVLVVTRCVDGIRDEVSRVAVAGPGSAVVEVRGRTAEIVWHTDRHREVVAVVDLAHLSTTVANGFVGVVAGAYAVGSGSVTIGPFAQRGR
ncbi:family 43 glycosylhydrolase [Microbacterium sp. NPDC089189]|uniref:glycoside hydrolase family 43 protein n=1 Tax=Microbacterium sp. NPDC089189 TaxID=3154972 RepID=UPI00344A31D6